MTVNGTLAVPLVDDIMRDDDLVKALDAAWVFLCTCLVFWEQAGFAMWEAGSLREKSVHSILMKNICDACIGAVAFFTLGYAFGMGSGNKFIGAEYFFLWNVDKEDYPLLFFHWAFAATAATTVSGCMAERTKFSAYLIYSFFITAWVYAVALHWVWSDEGFLCAWGEDSLFGRGLIDFAGSGLVHMIGGIAGLVGSIIVGPRLGRFQKGQERSSFRGHSLAFSTLGVYCLWFGWFGFNAGCTYGVTGGRWKTVGLIVINTAISPSTSALAALAFERWRKGHYDASLTTNAVVAGLVGITGPCGVVEPWAAAIIGLCSGIIYCLTWRLHEYLKVDDPVHAIAVHAWPGAWGCIASGLFASESQLEELGYVAGGGLFTSGSAKQLGAQLVGTIILLLWTVACSSLVFGGLHFMGMLRVSKEDEECGVDAAEHGVHQELPSRCQTLPAQTEIISRSTQAKDTGQAKCNALPEHHKKASQ